MVDQSLAMFGNHDQIPIYRKILAICLIERTWIKLKDEIPKDQAAYKRGRSTTEQAFCLKILIEKAITSQNYNLIIFMIDMSKAFDSVNRSKLLTQLEEILNEVEMRLMYLLITDVVLNVRLGTKTGEEIQTNIGVAQGDCLSALLFIFYLAHIMSPITHNPTKEDHNNENFWSDLDWMIDRDTHNVEIDPKYADDVNFIRTHQSKINPPK